MGAAREPSNQSAVRQLIEIGTDELIGPMEAVDGTPIADIEPVLC